MNFGFVFKILKNDQPLRVNNSWSEDREYVESRCEDLIRMSNRIGLDNKYEVVVSHPELDFTDEKFIDNLKK